jgi:protein-S-isoprenylcysteine O-methyltransferase Ste14
MEVVRMRRACGIALGLITHAVFAVTVWRLFFFLQNTHHATSPGSLYVDVLLALQFAVPHSVLLHPTTRQRLSKLVPSAMYGCCYTLVTCGNLWLIFLFWQQSALSLWQFTGISSHLATAGFLGSWGALFYSLSLTGLGWQTGWTPWWHWFRNQPAPKREFAPKGAYCWIRHPVYLSFMGLLWFTPCMTLDRAVLTAIWTAYLFYGSYLKDKRLTYYLGAQYRRYLIEVPAYPLPFWTLSGRRYLHGAVADPDYKSCHSSLAQSLSLLGAVRSLFRDRIVRSRVTRKERVGEF